MRKRTILFYILFSVSGLIYFIISIFYTGVKVDTIDWNQAIRRYSHLIIIGGMLCTIGLIFFSVTAKKKTKVINRVRACLIILIITTLIFSIICIPKWDTYENTNKESLNAISSLYE